MKLEKLGPVGPEQFWTTFPNRRISLNEGLVTKNPNQV